MVKLNNIINAEPITGPTTAHADQETDVNQKRNPYDSQKPTHREEHPEEKYEPLPNTITNSYQQNIKGDLATAKRDLTSFDKEYPTKTNNLRFLNLSEKISETARKL